MQDWNDLKFLLVLHRAGSLAQAGRTLGVNETTVARRLKALERDLRTPLFARDRSGRFRATDTGLLVIQRAERIEHEAATIDETVGRLKERLAGTVRVTSVPMIVNRVLVPRLVDFTRAHPDVTVELVPVSHNLSLSKREADLALRLARPGTGGFGTKARRIGTLHFAIYCPVSTDPPDLTWIGYDDEHAHLPQARWLAAAGNASPVRVSDAETAREAVAVGLGKTILPAIIGDADHRLRRADAGSDLPTRDIWLLSHEDQDFRGAVATMKEWLSRIEWPTG